MFFFFLKERPLELGVSKSVNRSDAEWGARRKTAHSFTVNGSIPLFRCQSPPYLHPCRPTGCSFDRKRFHCPGSWDPSRGRVESSMEAKGQLLYRASLALYEGLSAPPGGGTAVCWLANLSRFSSCPIISGTGSVRKWITSFPPRSICLLPNLHLPLNSPRLFARCADLLRSSLIS